MSKFWPIRRIGWKAALEILRNQDKDNTQEIRIGKDGNGWIHWHHYTRSTYHLDSGGIDWYLTKKSIDILREKTPEFFKK